MATSKKGTKVTPVVNKEIESTEIPVTNQEVKKLPGSKDPAKKEVPQVTFTHAIWGLRVEDSKNIEVQDLVKANRKVTNKLFNNQDPHFKKVKTLTLTMEFNGKSLVTQITEGEWIPSMEELIEFVNQEGTPIVKQEQPVETK